MGLTWVGFYWIQSPEGSVLGPLWFLIYINNQESNIKSSIKFFADGTMLG